MGAISGVALLAKGTRDSVVDAFTKYM
eukprot:COSAG01_NODE_38122_length_494_cov_0.615190_1_plen_26_part_01